MCCSHGYLRHLRSYFLKWSLCCMVGSHALFRTCLRLASWYASCGRLQMPSACPTTTASRKAKVALESAAVAPVIAAEKRVCVCVNQQHKTTFIHHAVTGGTRRTIFHRFLLSTTHSNPIASSLATRSSVMHELGSPASNLFLYIRWLPTHRPSFGSAADAPIAPCSARAQP